MAILTMAVLTMAVLTMGATFFFYMDQVFGWGLMGQHEVKDPTLATASQADASLSVASDVFASSALVASADLGASDVFGPRRSRKPPAGVSEGGALQELYQLEALLEIKLHRQHRQHSA